MLFHRKKNQINKIYKKYNKRMINLAIRNSFIIDFFKFFYLIKYLMNVSDYLFRMTLLMRSSHYQHIMGDSHVCNSGLCNIHQIKCYASFIIKIMHVYINLISTLNFFEFISLRNFIYK